MRLANSHLKKRSVLWTQVSDFILPLVCPSRPFLSNLITFHSLRDVICDILVFCVV